MFYGKMSLILKSRGNKMKFFKKVATILSLSMVIAAFTVPASLFAAKIVRISGTIVGDEDLIERNKATDAGVYKNTGSHSVANTVTVGGGVISLPSPNPLPAMVTFDKATSGGHSRTGAHFKDGYWVQVGGRETGTNKFYLYRELDDSQETIEAQFNSATSKFENVSTTRDFIINTLNARIAIRDDGKLYIYIVKQGSPNEIIAETWLSIDVNAKIVSVGQESCGSDEIFGRKIRPCVKITKTDFSGGSTVQFHFKLRDEYTTSGSGLVIRF